MGMYVNPKEETKEEFLKREGTEVNHIAWAFVPAGQLPVVLILNGHFTAAGVAYTESELKEFTRPGDMRPRRIFLVPIDKLIPNVLPTDAKTLGELQKKAVEA